MLVFVFPLFAVRAGAAILNEDGKAVVRLAGDEYNQIVAHTLVVTDRDLTWYPERVAGSMVPAGTVLPGEVSLSVTVLDKTMPEVHSLANGVIILTTGTLLALENEI